ncbi:MAG: efflux RND transporter periplasmic adaptor subunit [Verrucomicrobia bacterium]|nr:efflux RND transporter periplasmic adaptor subunit [Verrucomicrobiota bacterium]
MPKLLPLLAGLICVLAACSKPQDNRPKNPAAQVVPIEVALATNVPWDRAFAIVGTLFPKDEATLGAEVEGRVEKTWVDFGDRIQAGQLLAQIDTTTYDALAKQAAANLARAQATATNAEQNLRRVQKLSLDKIASQSDLDTAVAEADQARAAVKAAEATEAVARLNLARSNVKAPFDAAVAERIASAGDFLKVGSPLYRVVNDGVLKFIFQVPERHAAQVRKEQPVVFTVDAYPGQKFEGRVYLISPQITTTTRAFSVGALVQNPDRKLKANTFARGEIVFERDVPTTVAPLDAVVSFAGVTKVFVVEDGVARSRDVEVGRIRDGVQEVLAGLKPGETVVVSGQTKLRDGTKVRVKAR